ncbi:MAG TPA: hypothetical protein VIJ46_05290, partial [Rhabdochlamydiaceae bacterium]
SPTLHAIDNALEEDLSADRQAQTRYLGIIQTIFSNPHSPQALARNTASSIRDALHSLISEEKGPVAKEILTQIEPLFKDLQTIAPPAFEAGIRDGIAQLRKELVPAWNSGRSSELKSQLATLHPALLEAVEERLTAFATTKETV